MRTLTKQICSCAALALALSMPSAVLAGNAGTMAGQTGAGLCMSSLMGFIAGIVGSNLPSHLTWSTPMTC